MIRQTLSALALLAATAGLLSAEVISRTVEYKDGETILEGFLAYDDNSDIERPGVLIVHQWTGVSGHERNVAKKLAKAGYVALVADIYGKGVRPKAPEESGKLAGQYRNPEGRKDFRRRLNLGLEQLKTTERVDDSMTAAIGYCFGGTGVLELARSGADVAGVVSFHGSLDSPAPGDGKNIKSKVLVLHGFDDPYISKEDFDAFTKEMADSDIDWQLMMYGEAVHSFTDKDASSDGARYDEKADARSWRLMNDFFDNDVFGKEWKKAIRGSADNKGENTKKPADAKRAAKDAEEAAWKAVDKNAPKPEEEAKEKASEDTMMK